MCGDEKSRSLLHDILKHSFAVRPRENMSTTTANIPKRASYKASDVCQLVGIEPYVLRSWTEEFPELGRTTTNGNTRVFRYRDVQLALRLKHLLFSEGLTLGGARRKLDEENETARIEADSDVKVSQTVQRSKENESKKQLRLEINEVKKELKSLLHLLAKDDGPAIGAKTPAKRQRSNLASKSKSKTKR